MSLEYQKALSQGLIAHEDVSTLKGTAHSGSEAKAVLLIRDEDPKELEVNGWIPLTSAKFLLKLLPRHGNSSTRFSQRKNNGGGTASATRWRHPLSPADSASHPVVELTEQRRFRPAFAQFLNKRIYKGEICSHPVTTSLRVNPGWDKMIRDVFQPGHAAFDTGHFMLSLKKSACVIEQSRLSRYNAAHIEGELALLLASHLYGGYKGKARLIQLNATFTEDALQDEKDETSDTWGELGSAKMALRCLAGHPRLLLLSHAVFHFYTGSRPVASLRPLERSRPFYASSMGKFPSFWPSQFMANSDIGSGCPASGGRNDAGNDSTITTVPQDADSPSTAWTGAPEQMDESQIPQDTWEISADDTTGDWDAKEEGARSLPPSPDKRDEPDNQNHKPLSRTDKQEELSRAIKRIKAFLTAPEEDNLKLQLGHGLTSSKELTRLLDEARAKYYFEGDTLVVKSMRPAHESLSEFASCVYGQLAREIFTPEEWENVAMNSGPVRLYGKIEGYGKKPQSCVKIPDQAYVVTDPGTSRGFRTVIFEAAFSETYDDLIRDMRQWLLHSDGQVQLVVLANIKEDKQALAMQQKSGAFRDRAARLLEDFGNSLGRAKHADILERPTEACAQQESQATKIYERQPHVGGIRAQIERHVQPSDWVGPITAELEYWQLAGFEPQRRGQRVRVFPGHVIGELPPLYIGDVIHPDCRGSFSNFDASRKLIPDPKHFVKRLTRGIHELSVDCALNFACPRNSDEDDEDYRE
ncbi:hypothetical protein IFM62136_10239 [Aspergillus lentulus]|nr:hypothetical protein IFM62136_10239 [Aspergillus lentulus]